MSSKTGIVIQELKVLFKTEILVQKLILYSNIDTEWVGYSYLFAPYLYIGYLPLL